MTLRNFLIILCLGNTLVLTHIVPARAYTPPLGIKNPDWGYLHPIDTPPPKWPADWPNKEVPGYYYYDNSSPHCSDRSRYGYPKRPRCTIPRKVIYEAGTYVEIHGGPYIKDAPQIFVFHGTPEKPVWFRGKSVEERPVLGGDIVFNGSFAFIENLLITQRNDRYLHSRVGANTGPKPHYASYLSFRHIEVRGDGRTVHTGHSAFGVSGNSSGEITENIVFSDMHIHHIGSSLRAPVDYHGIKVDKFARNIWVLDSKIHHLQGDSVQIGSVGLGKENRPHHIWIGGNKLHENVENALDVKNARDLIFASNDMYGFHATDSSAGNVIGLRSYASRANNIWIINNKIHKANIGIGAVAVDNVYILGNLIFNITYTNGKETRYAILLYESNRKNVVAGNVFDGNEYAIGLVKGATYDWDIQYNWFLKSEKDYVLYDGKRIADFENNRFYQFKIRWNENHYLSLSEFNKTSGLCNHCWNFRSMPKVNFEIKARNMVVSPATADSLPHKAYTLFMQRYKINLGSLYIDKNNGARK